MSDQIESDLEKLLKKFALHNALKYDGKANSKAVLGKVLAEQPDLRKNIDDLRTKITEIVDEISGLSLSQQREELSKLAPEMLEARKEPEKDKELTPLQNVGDNVVMRFAPGPSGPLHIGHARAAILNDEYCRSYKGKLILRLEDTNPAKIKPEAYDMIKEDLEWLGVKYHEVVTQSDRFDFYFKHAKELLEGGHSYICTCDVEDWRSRKINKQPCKDRELPVEEQLDRWEKMHDGTYSEGEVTYIVKTDLSHPNPAVRDFIAFRIIDKPLHPRTGDKVRVYPLMNFSVALDDHLLGLTHVLRGKDHLNNTYRQGYLYDYFKWPKPEYIHYGWVSIEGTILKTSEITEKIAAGEISNWSDVRLGTFRALALRGIRSEAVRRYWLEVGTKEVDVKFSWDTLYAFNRELVDADAPRYFFVPDPVELKLTGITELEGHAPLHPEYPERGSRKVQLKSESGAPIPINIAEEDWSELKNTKLFRLKDLCNVEPKGDNTIEYKGDDTSVLKTGDVKIVQWVSGSEYIRVNLVMPEGKTIYGLGETALKSAVGKLVQLERIGYATVNEPSAVQDITKERTNEGKIDILVLYSHK
ncbi:MAG: glutamate--tRNA ligase [Thermoplasmata archaeon]|nr:MAG: glutamate--tRNA ligase [Thermoplasmata archaeon]